MTVPVLIKCIGLLATSYKQAGHVWCRCTDDRPTEEDLRALARAYNSTRKLHQQTMTALIGNGYELGAVAEESAHQSTRHY